MGLRLVETRLSASHSERVEKMLSDLSNLAVWSVEEGEVRSWHVLAFSEDVETIVDAFEESFSDESGFRLVIFEVEATVPKPRYESDDKPESPASDPSGEQTSRRLAQINIEELYEDIIDGVRLSWDYVVMVAMSAVVAAVGIYRDDLVLVIAGMIIAPLLYPNMALALATNLADKDLGWHALKVNALGLLAALAVAVLFGLVMPIESSFESTGLRTSIGSLDVVVAAAAGTAAALSFVSQKSGTVVGVMVAVALLPPLVSLGMLFGAGYWSMAVAPLLLFLINVICINLAAVITFVAWKVSPRTHHEEKRAHRAWRRAIALWVLLLGALVALALFAGEYWEPFW